MNISDDIVYGRQALRKGEPWIVPASLRHLESLAGLQHFNAFEWGAGGSTVWFARNCRSILSVEHHPDWHGRVLEMLLNGGDATRLRAQVMLVRGEPEKGDDKFRAYADVINRYSDESFDLVFVDGEASSRGWCVTNAMPKIKPGGYLLVDNSNWLKRDIGWERIDFVAKNLNWVGQPGTFDWWTSFFTKPA